jgi:hypothetical protein
MKVLYRDKYKEFNALGWGFSYALITLAEEYKDFICTLIVEEQGGVVETKCGIGDKDDLITINPEKSFNAEWSNPELSTLGRQRTQLLRKRELPEEYKKFISIMIDISHEVGHIKTHEENGKSKIDKEKYKKDLEYRIKIEEEAEQEVTRIAKKYGFYDLINNFGEKS